MCCISASVADLARISPDYSTLLLINCVQFKKGEITMSCSIEYVNGHIEVYDENGIFLFSADNKQEALEELRCAA